MHASKDAFMFKKTRRKNKLVWLPVYDQPACISILHVSFHNHKQSIKRVRYTARDLASNVTIFWFLCCSQKIFHFILAESKVIKWREGVKVSSSVYFSFMIITTYIDYACNVQRCSWAYLNSKARKTTSLWLQKRLTLHNYSIKPDGRQSPNHEPRLPGSVWVQTPALPWTIMEELQNLYEMSIE